MNWQNEVLKRKEEVINDTQSFLRIKSVLDESTITKEAPFGEGINEALQYLLQKAEQDGFRTKNLDGYAAHIEMGEGDEIVGILCHIDVVPEGDGWTKPPFGAEIEDGKIYARGAIDDKGPTMAIYHAMKLVKDLGLPLTKKVRMIIGTDEESDWRCVDHYFKHEEMPTLGFAPDADFPIINAEKGIIDAKIKLDLPSLSDKECQLLSFESGRRFNMVPDYAKATVQLVEQTNKLKEAFDDFLQSEAVQGKMDMANSTITFTIEGVSAHAMEPNNGKNAGVLLATFLSLPPVMLDARGSTYVKWISEMFYGDTRGNRLGIACSDEISGELTVNAAMFRYEADGESEVGFNIRYPVTAVGEEIEQKLRSLGDGEIIHFTNSNPHYVEENHPLIETLSRVYEEQTGERTKLISIGGGTYARALKAGVAFGPLFPGREDVVHQKDEYMMIEDLLKATSIYTQAIYELAK